MTESERRPDDLASLLLHLQFQLDVAVPRVADGTWALPTTQVLLRDAAECVARQGAYQASQAELQELSTREHQVATEITRHAAKLQDRSVELQLVRLAALARLVFDRQRLLSLASITPQASAGGCGSTDVGATQLMSDTLNSVQFHDASSAADPQLAPTNALPRRDPVFAFHFVFNAQCRPEEDLLRLLQGYAETQKQHQLLKQQHREIVLAVPVCDHADEATTLEWVAELLDQLGGVDITGQEGHQSTASQDTDDLMLRQWQVAGFRWSLLGVRVTASGGLAHRTLDDLAAFVGNNRMWQPSQPVFKTPVTRELLGGAYPPVVVTLARLAAATTTQARNARAKAEWIDALQRHVASRVSANAGSDADCQEHVSWLPSAHDAVADLDHHVAIAHQLNTQLNSADAAESRRPEHPPQVLALQNDVQRLAEQHSQGNRRIEQLRTAQGGLDASTAELRQASQTMHEGHHAWLAAASDADLEQLHAQQDAFDRVQQERATALSNVANLVIHEAHLRQEIVRRLAEKQAELQRLTDEAARASEARLSQAAAVRTRMQELQEACQRLRLTWQASHKSLLQARAARKLHQVRLAESNRRVRDCMKALTAVQGCLATNERALAAAEAETRERRNSMEQAIDMQSHRRDYLELRAAEPGLSLEDQRRVVSALAALNQARQYANAPNEPAREVHNTQQATADAMDRLADARSAQEAAKLARSEHRHAAAVERSHASAVEECELGYANACRELAALVPPTVPVVLLEEAPGPISLPPGR